VAELELADRVVRDRVAEQAAVDLVVVLGLGAAEQAEALAVAKRRHRENG
jgi:hypothetical protein